MDCCRQTILRGDEIGKKARRFVLREEKFYGWKGRADEAISRFSEIALFFVTTIAFEDTLCTAALIYCHFEYQEKFNPIDVYSLEVADPSLDDDGRPKRTGLFTGQTVITKKGTMLHARNRRIKGGIAGAAAPTPARRVWTVFEALGDIAFSYPYSLILLEIQIFSQPIFATFELWFAKKFPNSGFICNFYTLRPPFLPPFRVNMFRLVFRTAYVLSTTGLAIAFPYFNSVLGVLGAINFWPLAIYFPLEMYLLQRKIGAWTRKWIILKTLSLLCFFVTVVGFLGDMMTYSFLLDRSSSDVLSQQWFYRSP
ncbi:hypothetical protein SAY87_012627 [Trapa incisa]|uniref:Amino acid transporter transmembrane domain-containing protein n=1 Tax=Trapa incisa TaxID=236973 RepID=A0AAN7GHR0_9MYRT|nr:hypothetical protein SAY87_012627 [Trapa incisa]